MIIPKSVKKNTLVKLECYDSIYHVKVSSIDKSGNITGNFIMISSVSAHKKDWVFNKNPQIYEEGVFLNKNISKIETLKDKKLVAAGWQKIFILNNSWQKTIFFVRF